MERKTALLAKARPASNNMAAEKIREVRGNKSEYFIFMAANVR
ncbi:hypothetical protein NSP_5560 [Nodularia spumigena CCY9414]|nr:hypothetical protein NSP_5560 [Nodularia spumigena CCY9414]